MRSRAGGIALVILVLVAAGLLWLLRLDEPQIGASTVPLRENARTSADAVPDVAPEPAAPGARSDATPTESASPAVVVPADTPWVTIRAIDGTTKTAVAGATVHWVDDTSHEAMQRTAGLTAIDQALLRVDTEEFAERFGWRTTTDGSGIAKVSRNGWLTVVVATASTFGELHLRPDLLAPADGFVVELVPDRRIVVQVVDDRGDPVPGVLVGLYARQVDGRTTGPGQWAAKTRTRAPDGIATIEHVQSVHPPLETDYERAQDWRVFTLPLTPGEPGTAVSLDEPAREPIVLRLPTCGRVVLVPPRVTGVPDVDLGDASLRDDAAHVGVGPGVPQADGSVLFPRVPVGRQYSASVRSDAVRPTTFAGPTARDEEITVHLPLVSDKILLAARLLVDGGEPARGATIGMLVSGTRFHANQWLRTDGTGRVLATWNALSGGDRIEKIAFFRSEPTAGHAELAPAELHLGLNDLGDVRLTQDQLVCAGRFVDADGPVRREVEFEVEHRPPASESEPEPMWDVAQMVSIHHAANGRFLVLGSPPPHDLRLVFDTDDQVPHDPVPFRVGTRDLEITIETAHRLSASVLLPGAAPPSAIVAQMVPAVRTTTSPEDDDRAAAEREHHHANAHGSGERRNLHWGTLRRGTYTLEIRSWLDTEPIARIPDVVVPPPAGGDRRLEDIDLRGASRVLHVRLFDANGALLERADGTVFAAGQRPDARWLGFEFRDAEFSLLVPKRALDLVFVHEESPPRTVRADGDRLDVQFLPWSTLPLVIAAVPPLPDDVHVIVWVQTANRRETPTHHQGDSDGWVELNPVPNHTMRVVDGRVDLPIGEDAHTVTLGLRHTDGRVEFGLLEDALHVTATSPPPVVRVSQDRWDRAIRSLLESVASDEERQRAGR